MSIPEECKEGGFFQFPLCLLAQQLSFRDLLDRAFGYGVCHYLDAKETDEDDPPCWDTPWRSHTSSRNKALDQARSMIGFTGGDIERHIRLHAVVANVETLWERQNRKTCWVRIRKDIYFDTRDEASLSERDWRVLCALYSAIGDKPFVEIGWQRIAWRAAGWLSPVNVQSQPRGPLYPRGQIERSLAKLVARHLVFVATYRRGQRFWSHRLSHEKLWDAIGAMKTKRPKEAADRKQLDLQRSLQIFSKKQQARSRP